MLSKKQVENVCMNGCGSDECRYLDSDDYDYGKFYCVKHRINQKQKIDQIVAEFIADCASKGIDPADQGDPIGDNCSGYPYLKHVEQGYDKKN
ncbi:MAG: hypothetical protein DWQ19_10685 [Crenarchaeota archaeon]|nr:MAG: hypothetical protein DWQ19_10685 [Thermoproteota archaeon]